MASSLILIESPPKAVWKKPTEECSFHTGGSPSITCKKNDKSLNVLHPWWSRQFSTDLVHFRRQVLSFIDSIYVMHAEECVIVADMIRVALDLNFQP